MTWVPAPAVTGAGSSWERRRGVSYVVIPAKAGIRLWVERKPAMDARLRGHDGGGSR